MATENCKETASASTNITQRGCNWAANGLVSSVLRYHYYNITVNTSNDNETRNIAARLAFNDLQCLRVLRSSEPKRGWGGLETEYSTKKSDCRTKISTNRKGIKHNWCILS